MSSLANFLGIYKQFKELVRDYGLKWRSSKSEELVISRLTKANRSDILEWIHSVGDKLSKLQDFVEFMLSSGLRFEESINSYNLIFDLSKKGKLNDYYDGEKGMLERYRFKEQFIRRTKKAFVSFVPKDVIQRIGNKEELTRYQVDNWIKRNSLKSRFGDIREYFATFMTQYLSQPEIDFLQGRISGTVFMRNYFNPALIRDLKERTFKAIEEMKKQSTR